MNDIDRQWAWAQVERMAEGSLPAEESRRMRAAMASDGRLRDAVERAVELRRDLRRLGRAPVPPSLRRRLSAIPAGGRRGRPKPRVPLWISAAAAAAGVAVVGALILTNRPEPVSSEQVAALRDLEIAMTYLRRSTDAATEGVTRAVGRGLREAIETSRDAIRDGEPQDDGGG